MAEKERELDTEPAAGAALDEQLNFKKRARRRLVGAIALALLAVIVLPMVMDQEPRPLTQDIQIRIPNQELGSVSVSPFSRLAPRPPPTPLPTPIKAIEPAPVPAAPVAAALSEETKPEAAKKTEVKTESPKASPVPPTEKPVEKLTERKAAEKTADKLTAKSATQASESARAAALLNGAQWVVQLGAYQDMANVKLLQGKIKELGYPSFTEKVDTPQGLRVRVRSGPFASREAAEKAQERLKKIGAGAPPGGVVTEK